MFDKMKFQPKKYDAVSWTIVNEAEQVVSQLITGQEFYPTQEECQAVCDRLAKTPLVTSGLIPVNNSEDVSFVRITMPQTSLDKFERGMQLAFHARKELPHMGFNHLSYSLPLDVIEAFGYDRFDSLKNINLDYADIQLNGDGTFHVRAKSSDWDDEWETSEGKSLSAFSPVEVA